MRKILLTVCAALALLATGVAAAGDAKAVKAALKQVSRLTEGVRGVTAEVEYAEIVDKQPIRGSGTIYVHFAGILRAQIGGDDPKTILFVPPLLYIYRPANETVEIYDVTSNPDRLGQYLMLGFMPNGSALRVQYDVRLVENSALDGRPMSSFLMVPKSEAAARAVSRIQLWVDPETGLPAQHEIVHAVGAVQLSVRYLNLTRSDELPDSLFRPDWPAGTTVVRK